MCYANSGGHKKTTIGNTDDRQRTFVDSAVTAPPIGLPPNGAKFCHTSKILLVGHQCCHALRQLYLIPLQSVGCWSFVGWLVG
jgi:hypothetical protein